MLMSFKILHVAAVFATPVSLVIENVVCFMISSGQTLIPSIVKCALFDRIQVRIIWSLNVEYINPKSQVS